VHPADGKAAGQLAATGDVGRLREWGLLMMSLGGAVALGLRRRRE
jgi:hypothetical protein